MENGHRRQPKDVSACALRLPQTAGPVFLHAVSLWWKSGFVLPLLAVLRAAGCQTSKPLPNTASPPETHRMRVDAILTPPEAKPSPPTPRQVSPGLTISSSNFFEGYVSSPLFFLDEEKFTNYADFQRRLRSLPKGTTLEWQRSDVHIAGAEYL
jgi:hypothetical protein